MNPRGHRGIAAVLMLLALVLSAVALLPARAQTSNVVTGLVSQCGATVYPAGALVTLTDANGALPPLTTTTGGDGSFTFTPPTANYTISVSKSGFYSNSTPENIATPFRFDGSQTVVVDVCLDGQPTPSIHPTFTVLNAANGTPVGGATISIYNPARLATPWSALVLTNTTNVTTGKTIADLWPATFEVRVNANGFAPFIETMTLSALSAPTISLRTQIMVVGHARNTQGQFISSGLTGWLYNLNAPVYNGTKVIKAVVNLSLFKFYAPAGSYRMVVAANGYTAFEKTLTLTSGNVSQDATLSTTTGEQIQTTVLFGAKDWNNITVWHNLTLNADSSLAGLNPVGLRDLRLQISYSLGNSLGTVGPNEFVNFTNWLRRDGPVYVTTDSFLLLNSRSYNSSVTSYKVTVSNTLLTPGAQVWINTSTTYQVKSSAWISYGQSKYFLNATLFPDSNTTYLKNQTYIIQLPRGYEMSSNTILPSSSIAVSNYTRIFLDPVVTSGTPQIRMVLQPALVGVARAKVVGPAGKYYVVNAAYQSYQAYVATSTNISFSAAESSNPPSNDSSRENFTWRFLGNVSVPNPPNNVRWGIQPTFDFLVAGPYIVNLTAVGSGGNVTYRNIDVLADGVAPVANFVTNRTGSGSAINTTLRINQGTIVKFDATLSSDLAYTGKNGVIPNSGYAWDFNGDRITDAVGRIVNWTFSTAGKFTVNLTVTDGVGWKGANASMTVIVNDTTPPKPNFVILDPANEYAPTTTLIEGHNYTFNASTTTDNYDNTSALNFTWIIPGPLIGKTGSPNRFYGMNITFGWSVWNLSYAVLLSVNDTGFGSGHPNTGNLTRNITVQIDWTQHADLFIVVGSMKIDNTNPQEGQTITITLNVTDKPNRAAARNIKVAVVEIAGTQITPLTPTWTLVDSQGNPLASQTIASGATATMRIQVTVQGQGNRTISVSVWDDTEPYTVRTAENNAQMAINISQPAWVTPAIIGAVVAVFAVFIFAMYYRRKVKAGEWQPRFRREKGEGGKEKPKKEKEAKEEKKRL